MLPQRRESGSVPCSGPRACQARAATDARRPRPRPQRRRAVKLVPLCLQAPEQTVPRALKLLLPARRPRPRPQRRRALLLCGTEAALHVCERKITELAPVASTCAHTCADVSHDLFTGRPPHRALHLLRVLAPAVFGHPHACRHLLAPTRLSATMPGLGRTRRAEALSTPHLLLA